MVTIKALHMTLEKLDILYYQKYMFTNVGLIYISESLYLKTSLHAFYEAKQGLNKAVGYKEQIIYFSIADSAVSSCQRSS